MPRKSEPNGTPRNARLIKRGDYVEVKGTTSKYRDVVRDVQIVLNMASGESISFSGDDDVLVIPSTLPVTTTDVEQVLTEQEQ